MALEIHQLAVLKDNYIYILREPLENKVAVVDPALAEPVIRKLSELGWNLDLILTTHHHSDHVGGVKELKAKYACRVVGPYADRKRIPGIDLALQDGEQSQLGAAKFHFFDTPGHTRGHCAYWFSDEHALFCGDTLFSLGCGRLFEGSPQQMWKSLLKLRALPDQTRVYCAHEYTAANARFAVTIEPDNQELLAYQQEVEKLRSENLPTIPSMLGLEKACNPFLRADQPELQAKLGMSDAVQVFAKVRQLKDHF